MDDNIHKDASQDIKYRWKGVFMHEMFHVFGIGHTQRRPDRDEHIVVIEDHIQPMFREQFEKCVDCKMHGPYECNSIMHYPSDIFGMKISVLNETVRLPTMAPLDPYICNKFGSYTPTKNDWKGLRYKLECNDDTFEDCDCAENYVYDYKKEYFVNGSDDMKKKHNGNDNNKKNGVNDQDNESRSTEAWSF